MPAPGTSGPCKSSPNSARFHCNLASLFAEQEKYDEALALYRRASSIDPAYAEAHCGLGERAARAGPLRGGAGPLSRGAAPSARPARGPLRSGHRARRAGRFRGCGTLLADGTAARPHAWPRAHAQLATLLRGKLPDDDLAAMRQLLADPDLHRRPAHGAALRPGPGARCPGRLRRGGRVAASRPTP